MPAVLLAPEAQQQFDDLPAAVRTRVLSVLLRLEGPEVSGVKWLTGGWAGHGRVRTGDYRIIFKKVGAQVIVVRISHRSVAYEK